MSLPIGSLQHKVCTETRCFGITIIYIYIYMYIRIYLSKVFFKHIHTHFANPYLPSTPSTFFHVCSDGSFRVLPWLWKFGCDLFGYGPSTLGWLPTWKRPMLAAQQKRPDEGKRCGFWDRMYEKNPEIIDWPTMKPGVAMITFWGSCFFFYMTYQGALKWWYIIHLLLWCLRGAFIASHPSIIDWKGVSSSHPTRKKLAVFLLGPR